MIFIIAMHALHALNFKKEGDRRGVVLELRFVLVQRCFESVIFELGKNLLGLTTIFKGVQGTKHFISKSKSMEISRNPCGLGYKHKYWSKKFFIAAFCYIVHLSQI